MDTTQKCLYLHVLSSKNKNAGDNNQGYYSPLSHDPFCVIFLATLYFEIILNVHENYNKIP